MFHRMNTDSDASPRSRAEHLIHPLEGWGVLA